MTTHFQIDDIGEDTNFHQVIINNTETKESISILPDLGARLNAVHLSLNGNLISVLSELKGSDFKTKDELFNNAILFPFAGRIRKGIYEFQNQRYQLPLNYSEEENACHGFLYDKNFNIISKNISEDFAEIGMSYCSKEITEGYPFLFKMSVFYKLTKSGQVSVFTKVKNLSKINMLFSNGWHPYYTLGNSIDELVLKFNGKEKIELDKFNVPSGARINSNNGKPNHIELYDKELDDVYKLVSESGRNDIYLFSKKMNAVLQIWQESGFNKYNYLVLYTPSHRKSIAIEPITSNIDSFNNKVDIIILKPGEQWSASFGFGLNKIAN